MSYGWSILAFFVGTFAGMFIVALLAGGATESAYRAGFCEGMQEGHEAGFADGIKSIGGVG